MYIYIYSIWTFKHELVIIVLLLKHTEWSCGWIRLGAGSQLQGNFLASLPVLFIVGVPSSLGFALDFPLDFSLPLCSLDFCSASGFFGLKSLDSFPVQLCCRPGDLGWIDTLNEQAACLFRDPISH